MGAFRNLAQSMGVRVSESTIEMTTAALRVNANSCIRRPTTPPMNINGVKTAIREMEMARMVKPTSAEPAIAAASGASPASIRRQITSSITMASSTTKPTAIVIAIRERLSRLNPRASITAAEPSRESGMTMLGISVALRSRRKRKITATTSPIVISKVTSTSITDARMVCVRSART